MIIDRQQNVPRLQTIRRRAGRDHRSNEHAAILVLKTEKMPLRRILQFRGGDAEIDVAIVMTVLDILEKSPDPRRRNHVGDALRDIAAITLERDAGHFRVLHYRAAAVARINLRADLNGEMRID